MSKTWHQRVYDMLATAQKQKMVTMSGFLAQIPRLDVVPSSYVYRRCDKKGIYRDVCSETTVKRTADLCVELGLMDPETGALTPIGERAVRPGSYDGIVRDQLWHILSKEFGLSRTKLTTIIRTVLRARLLDLPSAEKIWSELGEPGALPRFARLLRFLARCGGVRVSQRATYLPSTSR